MHKPFLLTTPNDIRILMVLVFFGAHQFWWGDPSAFWNQEWAEMIITDLGVTVWRNEIYPPSTPQRSQPVSFNDQRPVVEGLKSIADAHGVDLKVLLTVWSPPASMKWGASFSWAGDQNATRYPDENIQTNHGGTLNPNMYEEYANYLIDHIKQYENAGVDVYALSLQNELAFSQPFNSCTYTTYWYCELLNAVVPIIKQSYPEIKIFGSENMLHMEGKEENWRWFYHNAIKNNQNAPDNIDAFAVHGYNDGVAPTTGSSLAKMWTNHTEQFAKPLNKPAWMTETSGYIDSWEAGEEHPGALGLALDIHAALYYGNIEAWVWWQGSENPHTTNINQYVLMAGTTVGKKYYASKHFYRYIRPGADRVDATSPYEDVFVTAFQHPERNTQTLVIINAATDSRDVSIEGAGLPGHFNIYRTSASENCENIGVYSTGTNLVLPSRSLITLASDETLSGMIEGKEYNKNLSASDISIYPNPFTKGELTIVLKKKIHADAKISIYSLSGNIVQQFKNRAENGRITITPDLSAGMYLLTIEAEAQKITKLFCVQ
jgi:glucuronoarabinoxylan endo-1,4-beta-xylanase